MAFAKSNFNKTSNFYKNFRPVTPKPNETHTDNRYRLLPAKGSLAASGTWAKYYGTHFGYKGQDQQDQTKLRTRVFRCVEERDFRNGITKVACPECDLIAQKKKALEATKARLKAEGKSDEDIKMLTAPAEEWKREHNCDRKWFINAMNEAGEFGVLQISHKCKKDLDSVIDELVKDGIDPTAPEQGVWFNIKRTGRGIEVTDKVEVVKVKEKIDGRLVESIKMAPLTQEQLDKADEICPDLTEVVRVLTVQQIKMLVDGTGDPEEVDAIFNASEKRERSAPPVRENSAGLKQQSTTPVTKPVETKTDPKVETKAPPETKTESPVTESSDDEEAALLALQAKQLAELRAKKAKSDAKAAKPEVKSAASGTEQLSDEEYALMFDAQQG